MKVGAGRSGGRFEGHLEPEAFEAADEPALAMLRVEPVEVVRPEVLVDGVGIVEQVIGDDEDAVGDREGGALVAAPPGEAPVLGPEVVRPHAAGSLGGLGEGRAQPAIARARLAALALAGALAVAGAQPGPRGAV